MVRAPGATAWAVLVVLGWAVAPAAAHQANQAVPPPADQAVGSRLLDVPFFPQTEDLCGGAAVAMVLRYWGQRNVYPQDFATLVDRSAAGIRTDALAADVSRRGWQALSREAATGSSANWIHDQVELGRPVVALIEVGSNRYHYVVVVAWTAGQVVVHDPARAPFRVMSQTEFDRAWAPAGRWALLILPPVDGVLSSSAEPGLPAPEPPSENEPCSALVQQMVALARVGDLNGADAGLLAASRLCAGSAPVWRELAGLRFLQSQWADAIVFAERAVQLAPNDAPSWDLLATSRFLNDQPDAALEAWNRIGRPSVDLVNIEGARRTRHPVVAGLLDLPPRTLLTADARGRAARRLDALPSASLTSLRYQPVQGGLTEIEAVVVERPTLPRGIASMGAAAARAWLQHEARLEMAALTGSGELWSLAWRWWEDRPRVAFALALPNALGLPGVTTIESSWERSSYPARSAPAAGAPAVRSDERRRAALGTADWATRSLRWQAGVALDRWSEDSYLSAGGTLDLRLVDDRVSVGINASMWAPIGSGTRFITSGASSNWRSTRSAGRPSWLVLTGLELTSRSAPPDLWPGAGTGHARTPLLRAHPLLEGGVLNGPVFGRRLAHATVEYQRPLFSVLTGAIRLAAFVDAARAWRRVSTDEHSAWHADLGMGLRVALPGNSGTARVDLARGLRDRQVVVSAGWQSPWPGR